MKSSPLTRISLATLVVLASSAPASAQSLGQLQQENARLRAQIQALQAHDCSAPAESGSVWNHDGLDARIASIRVGPDTSPGRYVVTVALQLQNTGTKPLVLNYAERSISITDSNGYQYEVQYEKESGVKGIPVATSREASTNAVILPGSSRTVTFKGERYMKKGQTIGSGFDINATFVQLEDLGQGRIRTLRDFQVAFTSVSASRP